MRPLLSFAVIVQVCDPVTDKTELVAVVAVPVCCNETPENVIAEMVEPPAPAAVAVNRICEKPCNRIPQPDIVAFELIASCVIDKVGMTEDGTIAVMVFVTTEPIFLSLAL